MKKKKDHSSFITPNSGLEFVSLLYSLELPLMLLLKLEFSKI